MNCINHPDQPRVAFCQQCGNPLCETCARTIGSAVFCEPCLQARVAPPAAGVAPGPVVTTVPPLPETTASPFLAGVLGFIPGVGAMYNGQFVKAMIHVAVFALLCVITSHNGLFGIFIGAWVFYQVFEAAFTARARRDGDPLPDPFGLLRVEHEVNLKSRMGQSYPPYVPPASNYVPPASPYVAPASPYVPPASSYAPPYAPSPAPSRSNLPIGAVVLIGLGILFLMGSVNIFNIRLSHIFLPFFMMGLGVWLYCRRVFEYPAMQPDDDPAAYHAFYRQHALHSLRAPAYIILTGVLWLLNTLHLLRFGNNWGFEVGAYMMLAGVLVLVERMAGAPVEFDQPSAQPMPPATPPAAAEPETSLTHRNTEGQE